MPKGLALYIVHLFCPVINVQLFPINYYSSTYQFRILLCGTLKNSRCYLRLILVRSVFCMHARGREA